MWLQLFFFVIPLILLCCLKFIFHDKKSYLNITCYIQDRQFLIPTSRGMNNYHVFLAFDLFYILFYFLARGWIQWMLIYIYYSECIIEAGKGKRKIIVGKLYR